MTRVNLNLYYDPSYAEVFVNLKQSDGTHRLLAAVVDTGAQLSLFPIEVLEHLDYEQSKASRVLIQKAGIITSEVTKAVIKLYLEDIAGNQTQELTARAWFARTEVALIGFESILDRATLYIDYRNQREGWIELD